MAFYLGTSPATALDRKAFEAGPHRVCHQGIVYREEMQHSPSRAIDAAAEESEGSRCGRPLQALGTMEERAGRACVRSCSGQMHGSASLSGLYQRAENRPRRDLGADLGGQSGIPMRLCARPLFDSPSAASSDSALYRRCFRFLSSTLFSPHRRRAME